MIATRTETARKIKKETECTSSRACRMASTIASLVATGASTRKPATRATSAPTETAINRAFKTLYPGPNRREECENSGGRGALKESVQLG